MSVFWKPRLIMIIKNLICHVLIFKLISTKELLAKYKLSRQKYQQNIDSIADTFSMLMTNVEKKYQTKHVFYLSPSSGNDLADQAMDKILQKLHNKRFNCVVTVIDSHDCSHLKNKEIDYNERPKFFHYPDVYIIPVLPEQSLQCFDDQLKLLSKRRDYHTQATFIIISFQGSWASSNYSILFDTVWSRNLFSTILLAVRDGQQFVAYWAKPFSTDSKCRKTEIKGIKHKLVKDLRQNSIDLYEENESDYTGCVFLVATIPRPPHVIATKITINGQTNYIYKHGIEIELLKSVASRAKIAIEFSKTLTYDSDAIYYKFPNGSIGGTLQDVIDHKVDATFGGLAPTHIGYHLYDYIFPHKLCTFGFFLANARPIPHWQIFFIMFDVRVWILSIFSLIVVSLVYYWLEKRQWRSMNIIVFVEMLRMNIGFPVFLRPRSWSLRVLFFAWAIYSAHWYMMYTTLLVALQSNVPTEKEITTLEGLLRSGKQVQVDRLLHSLLAPLGDSTTRQLLHRSVKCDPSACLPDLLAHRNFSLLAETDPVEYSAQNHGIHCLSETLYTYSIAIILSRGNPLSGPLSNMSLRALEGGLTGHWESVAKRQVRKKGRTDKEAVTTHPFSLSDLRGAFVMLLSGLVFALFVFIVEIVISHY